jgi:hypothetical protein
VHPEVSGESGVVGKAPQGGRSAKISAQGAAAGAAAAAGAQEKKYQDPPGAPPQRAQEEKQQDRPGAPPGKRERNSDAVRRHEEILEDLYGQIKSLEFAVGEEGLIAVRGRILIVEQEAIRQESGRAAASSAAFEGLVAGVQRAGSRVSREHEQLKERVGKHARRIESLESLVQELESEHSSAFQRRIERIEAVLVEHSAAFERNIQHYQEGFDRNIKRIGEILAQQFDSNIKRIEENQFRDFSQVRGRAQACEAACEAQVSSVKSEWEIRFQNSEERIAFNAQGLRQCKALLGLEKLPEEEVQEIEQQVAKRRKFNPE